MEFESAALNAIQNAIFAPSIYNTQPWKFSIESGAVHLYPDFTRRLSILDPLGRELYISLGCALENLTIALNKKGFETEIRFFPTGYPYFETQDCIRVELILGKPFSIGIENFYEAIPKRQTNYNRFEATPVPREDWDRIQSTRLEKGVRIFTFKSTHEILAWEKWIELGDRSQLRNERFREELLSWIRFGRFESKRFRDGLPPDMIGVPNGPRWLGSFFLRHYNIADLRARRSRELLRNSSGLILITTTADHREAWVLAGRVLERIALLVTARGIQYGYLNQSLQVREISEAIKTHLGLQDQTLQALIRVGYSEPVRFSRRRPIEEVLIKGVSEGLAA